MTPTYYHISKSARAELISLLIEIGNTAKNSARTKEANMARKARLLKDRLECLKQC